MRPEYRFGIAEVADPRIAGAPAARLEEVIDRLRASLRVAVVYGGDKSDSGAVIHRTFNTRAWKSYQAVADDIARALRRIGFRHVVLFPDDMRLGERLRVENVQMAWLNTCGVQGHNPACHTPAVLELCGVPYVGHDPLVSTMLDNKQWFKRELLGAGLATACFATWHPARGTFRPERNSRFKRAFDGYGGPYIVKPAVGRASLHVHFVESEDGLSDAVAKVASATRCHVLIERFLPGREYVVAASGPVVARDGRLYRGAGPFVFGAQERALRPGERIFTSMDIEPITAARVRALDPAADGGIRAQLHALARDIYLEFDLGSLVRLDVRADESGRIHVLEANPKPDLKQPTDSVTSLICEGLVEHGMSYDDLILSIVADRLDRVLRRERGMYPHIEERLQ